MRNAWTLFSVLALVLGGLTVVTAGEEQKHGQHDGKVSISGEVSVSGEVLDMACYIAHGAQGADHGGCAKLCAKNGQPLGLLASDGTVYLLYAGHDDATAFDKTKEFAGDKVKISGKASSKAGIAGIEVQSVQAL